MEYDAIRNLVLDEGKRLDGRTTTQIRPIWSEVGYLPCCSRFSRIHPWRNPIINFTVTLGAKDDEQMIDGAFINGYQKFLITL